jgi:hypothetical protein
MKVTSKFRTNMRWASTLFILLLTLAFSGCKDKAQPVRYVLPEGFHGVFQISEDSQKGVDLVKSNGVLFVTVPTNGIVVVKDCSFQMKWHQNTAIFPDGRIISEEDFDTNAVVLHEVFYTGQTNWILVGTDREARIAESMVFKPVQLARPLSEDDIPH